MTNFGFQRDKTRDQLSKEFSRTIHEIECTLSLLMHQWERFNEGDDRDKTECVSSACHDLRAMMSHIDLASLASRAERLDIFTTLDD